MLPAILAPADSASSCSSSSESRPAAEGSPARPRGAFFKLTPTSSTLSRLSTDCAVFMRMDWPWPRANCGKFYSLVIQLYAECTRNKGREFQPKVAAAGRLEVSTRSGEQAHAAPGPLRLRPV